MGDLLEQSKRGEDVGNNFIKIRRIKRENSECQPHKVREALAVCGAWIEPVEFEENELNEFRGRIVMNY